MTQLPRALNPRPTLYHNREREPSCASQQILTANIRFGSLADIEARSMNVRFAPRKRTFFGGWTLLSEPTIVLCSTRAQ